MRFAIVLHAHCIWPLRTASVQSSAILSVSIPSHAPDSIEFIALARISRHIIPDHHTRTYVRVYVFYVIHPLSHAPPLFHMSSHAAKIGRGNVHLPRTTFRNGPLLRIVQPLPHCPIAARMHKASPSSVASLSVPSLTPHPCPLLASVRIHIPSLPGLPTQWGSSYWQP